LLGQIAQWEREAGSKRTSAALAQLRRSGKAYCGRVPFGYRRDRDKLVRVPLEQRAIDEAARLDREGASFREIAKVLEERRVKPHSRAQNEREIGGPSNRFFLGMATEWLPSAR
jgi:DNA invertase Pin-like site-specific DNA recombinase